MIAACPKCSARYRIEQERVRPEGVRLRCSRCEAVFRVRSPEPRPQPAREPVPPAVGPPAPAPVAPAIEPPAPAPRSGQPPAFEPLEAGDLDRDRLVLVADPMIDEGKATAAALAAWGLQPILVHDGVEAILAIQRKLPRAVVIDAALPKMYGFQVCELLKRNESLRHIQVILVGAIHDRTRYRRSPTEIYGADAYLERPQLPDALWPMLRGFGLPLAGGPPRPAPTPPLPETTPLFRELPPVDPSPAAVPAAAPAGTDLDRPTATDPVLGAEIAKAERLARIVVSDIVLYNQQKFDAAVEADDVLTAMSSDLEEGRTLFAQRIDVRVRESRDFLTEELVRVARMRRSQ